MALHRNKQMHRDIAPKNIFLHNETEDLDTVIAKLGDFGLSREF